MNEDKLSVAVKPHHGAPTLFVNDTPRTGLMFYAPDVVTELGRERWREFVEVGVHVVSTPFNLGTFATETPDFSGFDQQIRAIREVDPTALILPRVGIVPAKPWADQHPDERMKHFDPETGDYSFDGCTAGISFSSLLWREAMTPILQAFVRHVEEHAQEAVLGYHLGAGAAAEWSYLWDMMMSDYSVAHGNAYRRWLSQRYDGDVERLREMWQDASVAFDTVEVPRDRTRGRGDASLLDPCRERRLIDYLTFHSETVADAILYFSGIVKSTLRDVDCQKLCGVFYGYYFWDAGWPCGLHNSGHHAMQPVLASPDIDFICAPYSYQERSAGGMFMPQLPADSLRLNGKLFLNEDDTCTFAAKPGYGAGRCPDLPLTLGVLRRNAVGMRAVGGTQWWMDIISQGWFSHPGILKEISGLVRLFEQQLEEDRSPAPELAVVVSQESMCYLRFDGAMTDATVPRQLSELAAMGVPFRLYYASDLERVFATPEGDKIKMVIFANCPYFTEAQRQTIRDHVTTRGRTVLWIYAAGLVTDAEISLDVMAELTGIRANWWDRAWPMRAVSCITGDRMTYGSDSYVDPWLYGDDPEAAVHGWMRGKTDQPFADSPALLTKTFDHWQSWWSAVAPVPGAILREIARHAGVHIYTENGDQPLLAHGLLGVHAACDGERTVYLPGPSMVKDALTDELVAEAASQFTVTMKRGDTGIWSVMDA